MRPTKQIIDRLAQMESTARSPAWQEQQRQARVATMTLEERIAMGRRRFEAAIDGADTDNARRIRAWLMNVFGDIDLIEHKQGILDGLETYIRERAE